MSSNNYTNLFTILTDTDLYTSVRANRPFNLSQIIPLAKVRFKWIVDNWISLYPKFKSYSNGDGDLLASLENFNRIVLSYNLGNTQNAFDNISNIQAFSSFLSLITLDQMDLTSAEIDAVNKEIQRVNSLEEADFRNMLDFLYMANQIAAEQVGLGDADAAKLMGRTVSKKQRTATVSDLEEMDRNIEFIKFIEGIIFDIKSRRSIPPNLLTMDNSSIENRDDVSLIDTYQSYIAIPFEISLEDIAQRYLGDKRQWIELVTINNLLPPFVDEVGQKFLILSPPAVNNLVISSDRKSEIPVGTKVSLGSYRIREETRVVNKVIDNKNGTMILFLSGVQDLFKFKITEGAFVRIYSPGTVNKGSFVKIPLNVSAPFKNPNFTPSRDELRRLDNVLLSFGVDIARDEKTKSILVDASGNFQLSYGLTNIRQAVLSALRVTIGELPFHPTYGINSNIGDRYFGSTDEAVIFSDVLRKTLLSDPRYSDIQVAGLQVMQNGFTLNLIVFVAGSNVPIPLSFVA